MTEFRCPVCGKASCTDMEVSVIEEIEMPRGEESARFRMPKQHVREGRGVAGYKGDVEVYDTTTEEKPKNVKVISGTKARQPKENK